METIVIRKELHQYIDNGDEKLLKLLLALAKEYNDSKVIDADYNFTNEEIKEFDKRRAKRLSGENMVYNWEDAKRVITRV